MERKRGPMKEKKILKMSVWKIQVENCKDKIKKTRQIFNTNKIYGILY